MNLSGQYFKTLLITKLQGKLGNYVKHWLSPTVNCRAKSFRALRIKLAFSDSVAEFQMIIAIYSFWGFSLLADITFDRPLLRDFHPITP